MPTSVPMFPDAHALEGTDFFYLLQGMNLDRDKKVTLSVLREYVSQRGADTHVENYDGTTPVWEVDTTNTRSLVILLQGAGASHVTKLRFLGHVPDGCTVTVVNATDHEMPAVAGNEVGLAGNCQPPFGTFGRNEVVELTWGDDFGYLCQHTMDRNVVNAAFVSMGTSLGNVAASLSTQIADEATRAEQAEAGLATGVAKATADLREIDLSVATSVDISGDSDQLIQLTNGSGAAYAIDGSLAVGKRATIYNDSGYGVTLTYALSNISVKLAIGESLEVLVTGLLNPGFPMEMLLDYSVSRLGPVVERATLSSSALSAAGYKACAQVAKTPGTYLVSGWVEVNVFTVAGSVTAATATLRDQGATSQGRDFSLPAVWKTPVGQSARLFLPIPPTVWKTTAASGDYCELDVSLPGAGVVDFVKCELVAQRISALGPFA